MITFKLDLERLTHSLKTAIAVLIGTLTAKIIGPPADQWVVITIIVVMCAQIYVGGVIRKAYFRFLGTVLGCLFATFTLASFGHSPIAIMVTIGLSSFVFSYFSIGKEVLAYAGTLGAVTTAIILLGQSPTLSFAAQRFLEICLGLLIASLVSQFILPIHASKHLKRAQAATLKHLQKYYQLTMTSASKNSLQELDEAIAQSLIQQRHLAKESQSEPTAIKLHAEKFLHILLYERELFRAIGLAHAALIELTDKPVCYQLLEKTESFHPRIIDALSTLIQTIESSKPRHPHIDLPTIASIDISTETTLNENETRAVQGFLFSMHTLLKSLRNIAGLYNIQVLSDE